MILECGVDVMMRALHRRLTVGPQAMVVPGEVRAVCEYVDFGLHHVLAAMPGVTNEDHQLSERGYLAVVQGLGGEEERDEGTEGLKEDVEVNFLILIDHTISEKREFR